MIDLWPQITAAFVTGVLGSAHCLGMCSGISGLFAVHAAATSLSSQVPRAIAYNLGRILTYTVLGAAVALLGQTMVDFMPRLAAPVRLVSGVLIILIGLQVAFNWRILTPLENLGAKLWKKIAPTAKGLLPVNSGARALGLGLVWGFLPCGLVYSVLLLAASTTDPVAGSVVMLGFGLGTLPAMIATGLSASKLAQFMNRRRLGAGLLIVLIGLATVAMPMMTLSGSRDHSMHEHNGTPQQRAAP